MYDDKGNAMEPNKIAAGPSWAQAYMKPGDRSKKAFKEVWPDPKKTDVAKRPRPSDREMQSRRDRIIQISRDLRLTAIELAEELNIPLQPLYRELRKLVKAGTLRKTMGYTENNVRIAYYSIAC